MQVDVDRHKLIFHPDRVCEWQKSGDCFPIYVEIGATNKCNHRCVFCALDWIKNGKKDIDPKVMKTVLEDMAACGVKSVMFAGEGEPLMHRNICDFIRTAKSYGLDVALSTNGTLFSETIARICLPYLSWIRISLDAGTGRAHRQVHRGGKGDFDKIINNLRSAVEIRDKNRYPVVLGAQLLIIPETIGDILPFVRLMKEIGMDNAQLKPYSQHPLSANRYSVNHSAIQSIINEALKENNKDFQVIYRQESINRLQENRTYSECFGLPFYALIEADGSIVPCNLFHGNKKYTYGNLTNNSFRDIWESPERKQVIELLRSRGVNQCRYGCRLNAINKYLFMLKYPHPHVNFI